MEFITLYDITDEVLQVKQVNIDNANDFVTALAAQYGVTVPVATVKARRIAVMHACVLRCLDLIGKDSSANYDGKADTDIYKLKLDVYKGEQKELMASLSAADFTDSAIRNGGYSSIPLGRG